MKDLRGRKFLDEKEANVLFENVLGGGSQPNNSMMNTSGASGTPGISTLKYYPRKGH